MNVIPDPQYLARKGKSHYQNKQYLESANTFHAARLGFEAKGNWLDAAEMANNCSVAYLQSGEFLQAYNELEGVEEHFIKAGDLKRQGITVGNLAASLEALGRIDEALLAYQKSADLLGKSGDDQLRLKAMQSLSSLQLRSGKRIQALVSMQQGIEGLKQPTVVQKMVKSLIKYPFEITNKDR